MKKKILINLSVLAIMISIGLSAGTNEYSYASIHPTSTIDVVFPDIHYHANLIDIRVSVESVASLSKVIRPKPRPYIPFKLHLNKHQMQCIAMNVYHEARNQNDKGQQAIAWVTINRMINHDYPKTACKVVYQGHYVNGKVVRNQCQFSWYCDGKPDGVFNHKAFIRALVNTKIALIRFNRNPKLDPTHGAIMYHADYSDPNWKKDYTETAVIGDHIFYKKG